MDYDKHLDEQYGHLTINLVKHDTGAGDCYPAYIEAHLERMPKDKGSTALDLGNYIYRRFGLRYRPCPEYRGRGKSTTLRWFMNWDDFEPIRANVLKAMGKDERMLRITRYIPNEFQSLIIQNASRGVRPVKVAI